MSNLRHYSCIAPGFVVLFIAFTLNAVAPIRQTSSDARSSGSIRGRIAINVVPEHPGDQNALDLRDCEVHLVSTEDQARELVYECGSWFQPPVGRYLFWLEQGALVSFQSVIKYVGEPSEESGLMLSKAMFPAGFVKLDDKTSISDDATFRVISLERIANYRAFDRRIGYESAKRPVTMPAGSVIAGVFDRNGRALSLSRPQAVTTAATTTVHPKRPEKRRSDVLAVLDRPVSERMKRCDAVLITPRGHGIRPGVALETDDRLVLAWYGIAAPSVVRLSVQCGGLQSLVQTVHVRRRTIETVRALLPRS